MAEATLIKFILALVGVVNGFFWFVIHGLKSSDSLAHIRIDGVNEKVSDQGNHLNEKITDQAKHNAETYARRDDVVQMKLEILNAIEGLRDEINR